MVTAPRPQSVSGHHEGLLPARLILGRPIGIVQPKRSKVVSIAPGCYSSRWSDSQEAGLQLHPPRRTLLQTILPAPGMANYRFALGKHVVADFLLLIAAFGLLPVQSHQFGQWAGPILVYGAIFTLLGYSERLYDREILRLPTEETVLLLKVFVWSTAMMSVAFVSWGGPAQHSVLKFITAASLGCTLMLVYRRCLREFLSRRVANGNTRNVLVVGAGQVGRKLARLIEEDPAERRRVCGFLDAKQLWRKDVLGGVEDLPAVARQEFVDEVLITVPQQSQIARKAIWQARRNHIDVKIVADVMGADPSRVTLERFEDIPVVTLWEEAVPVVRLLLKRIADLIFSGIGLICAAPLFAAIALAIKLDSPGSVFYRAPRVGLKGRHFLCYKFRTMVADADRLKEDLREQNERQGPFFKLAGDPRVTHVGRFLRRYSLDELPQMWNVLKGEMSLVGPRPHPVDDVQRYALEDYQRLEATPGLTGLWQVTARHDPSFERSMALDREYIGRWSLGMDLRILCKTIGAVVRGEGA
ncbi:MAG: sugar transferase [Acidobacteriaceae bacterium]|nr:sugar transferase [Acidobacteriaceae bacterium]